MNHIEVKLDGLDRSLTTIAASLGSSTSFSEDPTDGPQSLPPLRDFLSEQIPALVKLKKLQQTADGISSTLSSLSLITDSSQPPAYRETGPPELVRIRNKIELVKGILVGIINTKPNGPLKPLPPDLASDDDDDIFIVWCIADDRPSYMRALYQIIEDLQVKETEQWRSYMSLNRLGKDASDSLYRKHIRAKINSAKRAISEYHQKTVESKVKLGMPDLPSDPSLLDVDVFKVICLQSNDFYTQYHRPAIPRYDKAIGALIIKLMGMEEEEKRRLLAPRE
ncbi:hypothetical protein BGZ80_009662 [Entomortierella chlamydospora]|uniref:Uncharacterized protein n=1 Tax=Entomortierella chlamydospora TaxID=101097 RepID=A0A9P6MW17_9FUNG|nr:hypothetical protein BGZ79_004406 [Entomortierella chlamydospora]KAG0015742.1 hypothetical protein BGZ80_009662 [Entomortierella chlamydospora]